MSSFVTPRTTACQASLSFTISQSLLNFMSIELVMLTISSAAIPFSSCLQSFPAPESFLMGWLFASGGQSIGASASVLPLDIQCWLPLGLTGLIFLQSKGLSKSLLQQCSSRASILWLSAIFMVQLSLSHTHIHIHTHIFSPFHCTLSCIKVIIPQNSNYLRRRVEKYVVKVKVKFLFLNKK